MDPHMCTRRLQRINDRSVAGPTISVGREHFRIDGDARRFRSRRPRHNGVNSAGGSTFSRDGGSPIVLIVGRQGGVYPLERQADVRLNATMMEAGMIADAIDFQGVRTK